MSKMLNGPPGSPLGLCSGTNMTSISPIVPFLVVPQTGQPAGPLPQLFEIKIDPNSTTRARTCNIFGLIEAPPTIFARGPNRPFEENCSLSLRCCRVRLCWFPDHWQMGAPGSWRLTKTGTECLQ